MAAPKKAVAPVAGLRAVRSEDDLDPTVMYAVKQVELAVRSHLDELLKPAGITALQYTALTVLRRRDGLAAAELARNSFVRPQSMSDMISALSKRGLIERRRDPDDRKRLLISLTDSGRALLTAHDEQVRELETRMLSPLTAAEQRTFRALLNKTRHALNATPPH